MPAIRKVVDLWVSEFQTLGARPDINYVQIFENKGADDGLLEPAPARPDLGPAHRARPARQGRRAAAGLLPGARPHPAEPTT